MRRRVFLRAFLLALVAPVCAAGKGSPTKIMQKKFKLRADQIKPLVPPMGGAFATDRVTVGGMPVGYMYREASHRPEDSGWRFFAGDENQTYLADSNNTSIFAVNTIANYDPDIIPYLNNIAPCAFEKVANSHVYKKVT